MPTSERVAWKCSRTENGVPSATTSGTWYLPAWSAESWALGVPKRPSLAPSWGKVRHGEDSYGLSSQRARRGSPAQLAGLLLSRPFLLLLLPPATAALRESQALPQGSQSWKGRKEESPLTWICKLRPREGTKWPRGDYVWAANEYFNGGLPPSNPGLPLPHRETGNLRTLPEERTSGFIRLWTTLGTKNPKCPLTFPCWHSPENTLHATRDWE